MTRTKTGYLALAIPYATIHVRRGMSTEAPLVEEAAMAKNTGEGSRKGAVKERVQALNPVTQRYVKIDTTTGRIIDHKKSEGPYKGIRMAKVPSKKR